MDLYKIQEVCLIAYKQTWSRIFFEDCGLGYVTFTKRTHNLEIKSVELSII